MLHKIAFMTPNHCFLGELYSFINSTNRSYICHLIWQTQQPHMLTRELMNSAPVGITIRATTLKNKMNRAITGRP
jgi:hypothetical protein